MKAFDVTRAALLGDGIRLAATPLARMRGLLGRHGLSAGEGLWIRPSNSIHMFFMRFPIDAVFLSRDMRVVRTVGNLAPWKMVGPVWSAWSVLELPEGTIARTGCTIGDQIEVSG